MEAEGNYKLVTPFSFISETLTKSRNTDVLRTRLLFFERKKIGASDEINKLKLKQGKYQ